MLPDPKFGDVWMFKGGVMGPEPWLVVSNDMYLELFEGHLLAVPVRTNQQPGPYVVSEEIPGAGVAALDRVTSLPRDWRIEWIAALAPERREDVGRRIKNLIGP